MHGYEGTTVGVSHDDEALCDESYYWCYTVVFITHTWPLVT